MHDAFGCTQKIVFDQPQMSEEVLSGQHRLIADFRVSRSGGPRVAITFSTSSGHSCDLGTCVPKRSFLAAICDLELRF